MSHVPAGFLEVGTDGRGYVVVNHPDLKPDADCVGHIVFSPNEARAFALLMLKKADVAIVERDRSRFTSHEPRFTRCQ
jgi:hypothetical protein